MGLLQTTLCHIESNVHNSGVTIHIADIKHLDVCDTKFLPHGSNVPCSNKTGIPNCFPNRWK